MQRRSFLATCGAVTLAAACARFPYVSGQLDAGALVVNRREFSGRDGVLVEHASLAFPIYVHHAGGDQFSAVLTRCMHRGCTVEPTGGQLVCPCHGSEYTVAGSIVKGPTELPLHAFPVRVDAERVFILELDKAPR
jgi:cytochrome b6-f complex iron-sulfur subunit